MSTEIDEGGKRFELSVDRIDKSSKGMRLSAGEDEKSDKDKDEKGKEEKIEDSADSKVSKKADVPKSVSKDAKVEPKAESQYQNLDAKLPPELKAPVVEQKPSETQQKSFGKKKKKSPCCTIL